MCGVLHEARRDHVSVVPPVYNDNCSDDDDDLEPMRIKRHAAASSSDKSHGEGDVFSRELEVDYLPLRKLRHRGGGVVSSSRRKALLRRMRRSGAFSSKKSDGTDSSVEMQCHGAEPSEESHSDRKGSEKQEVQPPLEMQHDVAFSSEKSCANGSFTSAVKEEHNYPGCNCSGSLLCYDDPTDDDELIYHILRWECPPYRAKQPEMHRIVVTPDVEESEFVNKLEEIGCGNRFVACSVESPIAFFALLNTGEADKLKGVEGIHLVLACRHIMIRC